MLWILTVVMGLAIVIYQRWFIGNMMAELKRLSLIEHRGYGILSRPTEVPLYSVPQAIHYMLNGEYPMAVGIKPPTP